MEIKILDKIENPLLKRTKIIADVLYSGAPTPKRNEVRKLLAAQLGSEEALLVIKQLNPKFGPKAKLTAILYKEKAQLDALEPKYIIGRETGQKLHKAATAKAPAAGKKK
jgi:small subunit ribosomal protein S24e